MKRGKKYREAASRVDQSRRYSLAEAITLVKAGAFAGFDETIEVCTHLGVNPRHADQQIRGTVVLPHGTGKSIRVLVFAVGERATEAEAAGADFVGADDLVQKIQGGWLEFDAAIATPDMMPKVGRLGRILGPRGMMPNPKVGTVTVDVAKAVQEFKAGKIEYRVDRGSNVNVPVGKVSFTEDSLSENALTFLRELARARPSSLKGTYLRSATLASTMGPGVHLDTQEILNLAK
jgi:large subunit ribosomal protein L1